MGETDPHFYHGDKASRVIPDRKTREGYRFHSMDDRYRILFENSADAILIIEGDRFVDCNRAAVEMLRCEGKEQVLNRHPAELSPEFQPDGQSSVDKANEMMAIARRKGSYRFEWDHVRSDGEVFPVEVLLTAIPTDRGFDLHTVWRDISGRKDLENELRHTQKMETIGKLVSGIAHDFNNQLVPILGYAEILTEALSDRPDLLELIAAIEQAGNRAADLVQRLMAFSHKDIRRRSIVDLNDTVAELLDRMGQLIGEDIQLNFAGSTRPLPVEMDSGDIEQIVLNLVTNARDALPRGGMITLLLGRKQDDGEEYASLRVIDEGTGMDPHTLEQIFEPFFTTKGLGSATGLGLSTVYSLVTKAKGRVSAMSTPGEGSQFEVVLPIASGPVEMEQAHEAVDESRALVPVQAEKVKSLLVVEDDEQVARLMLGALSGAGYRVTEARDGAEALERLQSERFDLVLTDVVMPVMSGPMMVKKIESLGMDIPVLFVSGYTDDRLAVHGFDPGEITLLRKPFSPSTLLEHVEARLSRGT